MPQRYRLNGVFTLAALIVLLVTVDHFSPTTTILLAPHHVLRVQATCLRGLRVPMAAGLAPALGTHPANRVRDTVGADTARVAEAASWMRSPMSGMLSGLQPAGRHRALRRLSKGRWWRKEETNLSRLTSRFQYRARIPNRLLGAVSSAAPTLNTRGGWA